MPSFGSGFSGSGLTTGIEKGVAATSSACVTADYYIEYDDVSTKTRLLESFTSGHRNPYIKVFCIDNNSIVMSNSRTLFVAYTYILTMGPAGVHQVLCMPEGSLTPDTLPRNNHLHIKYHSSHWF